MSFGAMVTILVTWLLQSWQVEHRPAADRAAGAAIRDRGTAVAFVPGHRPAGCSGSIAESARGAGRSSLVASVGVMFVVNGIIRFVIGPDDQVFTDGVAVRGQRAPVQGSHRAPGGTRDQDHPGRSRSRCRRFWCCALFWFLGRTRTGKSMRAYSDNEDLALLSGINPERVVAVTWVIVGALAAVAGTLYGLDKSYKPFVYLSAAAADLRRRHRRRHRQSRRRHRWAASSSPSRRSPSPIAYKKFLGYLGPEGVGARGAGPAVGHRLQVRGVVHASWSWCCWSGRPGSSPGRRHE